MTLLAACSSLLIACLLAFVTVDVADVASARARAQLAADAAALAAVAESTPYGGGSPEVAARDLARMNGARLLSCICPPGDAAAQVRVQIGDVTASARAVFDPDLLRPADTLFSGGGLHPLLEASITQLVAASGGRVHVVSGYRSVEEQQILWTDALRRYGSAEAADDWVAPPGHSMHEKGLAVDLGGDVELAANLARSLDLPLHRPLSWEPWHFELAGARS